MLKKVVISVVVVIILTGVGYFTLKAVGIPSNLFGCKEKNWNNAFCIDKLPDFPQYIGDYVLTRFNKKNWDYDCDHIRDVTVCGTTIRLEYYNSKAELAIHVIPTIIDEENSVNYNLEAFTSAMGAVETDNIYRFPHDKKELAWKTKGEIDFIGTQIYKYIRNTDGGTKSYGGIQVADVNNEVIIYFLGVYPPIKD